MPQIGSAIEGIQTYGQKTMADSHPVVLPSDQKVSVGGVTVRIGAGSSIAVAASYTGGMVVGTATTSLIQFSSALRTPGGSGLLLSAMIIDTSNQKPAMDLLLYNTATSGSYVDHAVPTWTAADQVRLIRRVPILSTDWQTVTGGSSTSYAIADIGNLGKPLVGAGNSQNLFGMLICQGNATFTTNCLSIVLGISQD